MPCFLGVLREFFPNEVSRVKKKMETDGLSMGYSLRFFCGFKTALFGAKEVGVKGQRSWC